MLRVDALITYAQADLDGHEAKRRLADLQAKELQRLLTQHRIQELSFTLTYPWWKFWTQNRKFCVWLDQDELMVTEFGEHLFVGFIRLEGDDRRMVINHLMTPALDDVELARMSRTFPRIA